MHITDLQSHTGPATQIIDGALDAIDPNPFRRLDVAKLDEEKIEALMDYYLAHLAFPAPPVARRSGNRLELAFGHHHLEAAKRLNLLSIRVDIRPLTAEQMIALMPTESGEHAKPDFLVCLVAWMAARNSAQGGQPRTRPISRVCSVGFGRTHAGRSGGA